MKLRKKRILIISPEPWDHIFVSKHHYAIHLARRGNVVFFLNPPGHTNGIRRTSHENVYEINYKGFPAGLRFYPAFLQRRIIRFVFKRLQRMCSNSFDVVWSFDNSVFYDFSALPQKVLKLCHIVDFNQDFQTAKAAATADFCFTVTERIKLNLGRYNSRVHKINHGFNADYTHESTVRVGVRQKALYAGNLALPYIDWKLISILIENHPDVDFVFVGPNASVLSDNTQVSLAKKKVLASPNVSFPGSIGVKQLHMQYLTADVLFLAYREEYHDTQVANSHKMMEYLGSGRMVVASFTSEYIDVAERGLILMSRDNASLPMLFKEAILGLDHWNSQELHRARRAIAQDNTYDKQIDRIESIVDNGPSFHYVGKSTDHKSDTGFKGGFLL